MVCIYCGGKTRITNSRAQKRTHATWRRHLCTTCGQIFSTQERVDLAASVAFVAKDGSLHPFVRETLLQSVYESLKHRSDALIEALDLSDTVITQLLPKMQNGSLPRQVVIETTTQVLKRFDPVAATSYSAYHKI